MLKKLYVVFAFVVIGLYGTSVARGWEFGSSPQKVSGPDVRSASGGHVFIYRSGYRGGK